MPILEDPWASKVLHRGQHDQLVADIQNVANRAGIHYKWIWSSILPHLKSEGEMEWLVDMKVQPSKHNKYGWVYLGTDEFGQIDDRMCALAGLAIRNEISTRVMTLYELLNDLTDGEVPEHQALFIPDFHRAKEDGGMISHKQLHMLTAFIRQRKLAARLTFVHVPDIVAFKADYGADLPSLILTSYSTFEVNP